MDNQEAINILKYCTTLACEWHIKGRCDKSIEDRDFDTAIDMAIKALRKEQK